jgi:methylenetetrahydrofolate reductase (NADPH)
MKITDIFARNKRTFSFEFFPPRDEISAVDFGINVGQLLKLNPSFVSVTYGAGGSTQERTFALVDYLQNKIGLNTMAHYTCVGSSREKVNTDMTYLAQIGIENVMLLRGDRPKDDTGFSMADNAFSYAYELISFVRHNHYSFAVGAGANPEKHPEAPDMDTYLHNLKTKCEAGADFLITQLFFSNKQIKRFVDMASTTFPEELLEKMERYRNNPEKAYQAGLDHAIGQCTELLEQGAPGIHFYTLNKSRAAVELFESLPPALRKV